MKTLIITVLLLLHAPAALAGSAADAVKALSQGHSAVLCGNGSDINKDYVKILQQLPQGEGAVKIQEIERVNDTYNNQAICVILERIQTP